MVCYMGRDMHGYCMLRRSLCHTWMTLPSCTGRVSLVLAWLLLLAEVLYSTMSISSISSSVRKACMETRVSEGELCSRVWAVQG